MDDEDKYQGSSNLRKVSRLLTIGTFLAAIVGCISTKPGVNIANPSADVNDNSKIYVRAGQQMPAVVFQAGLADDKKVWNRVFPDIARDHSVVAFDRPGRNANPSTDAPRDPCTIAMEQRALLQSIGIRPPYILVGHSLGGLYQYVFAKLYPDDVVGIVLIDPTPPAHWQTLQKEAPAPAAMINVMRTVAFSSTDRREFDSQSECLDKIDMGRPLTQPSRILVAGRFTRAGEAGAYETMMKKSRQQWLALVKAPKLEVIWDSGHYIQTENPEDVTAAVQQVNAEIKEK